MGIGFGKSPLNFSSSLGIDFGIGFTMGIDFGIDLYSGIGIGLTTEIGFGIGFEKNPLNFASLSYPCWLVFASSSFTSFPSVFTSFPNCKRTEVKHT